MTMLGALNVTGLNVNAGRVAVNGRIELNVRY